jgi:hypothetical protein
LKTPVNNHTTVEISQNEGKDGPSADQCEDVPE